tara:strand:+ start:3276 stop:3458 length:183 start_codon:yes stop_codon:yes gene_type:complete
MFFKIAGVAQLVEQLICNQQVVGSNPIASSKILNLHLRKISNIIKTSFITSAGIFTRYSL